MHVVPLVLDDLPRNRQRHARLSGDRDVAANAGTDRCLWPLSETWVLIRRKRFQCTGKCRLIARIHPGGTEGDAAITQAEDTAVLITSQRTKRVHKRFPVLG